MRSSSLNNRIVIPFVKTSNISVPDAAANQSALLNTTEIMNENIRKIIKTQEQAERKYKLHQFCTYSLQKNHKPVLSLDHYLYSDKKKVVYCYVPKVACTNWKWMMYQFENWDASKQQMKLKQKVHFLHITSLSNKKLHKMKKHYYTFLFVRHPFERLVSAYRNKLLEPHPADHFFINTFGKHIIKTFRKNFTVTNNTCTFNEFVEFLIDKAAKKGSNSFNEHWKPQSLLCDICTARFDFIGKFETLIEDSRIILNELKVASWYVFPENDTDSYKTKTSDMYEQYMRNIPRDKIKKLYEIYKDDFDAFSYQPPNFLYNATLKIN